MGTVNKIIRGLTFNFFGKVCSSVLRIVNTIVLVEGLRSQGYGIYSLIYSLLLFLTPFYGFGVEATVVRFSSELRAKGQEDEIKSLFSLLLKFRFLIACVVSLLLFIFAGKIADFYSNPDLGNYIKLFAFIIIPWTVGSISTSLLQGLYEQPFLNVVGIGVQATNLFMLVLLLHFGYGLTGVIWANLISSVLSAFICMTRIRRFFIFNAPVLEEQLLGRVRKFGTVRTVGKLISYVELLPLVSLLLGYFQPVEEVGYFNLALSLSSYILGFIVSVVGRLGLVSLSEVNAKDAKAFSPTCKKFLKLIYFFAIPATVGSFIIGRNVIGVLYASEMAPVTPYFLALLLPTCLNLSTSIICNALLVLEKMEVYLKILLGTVGCFLASSIALIPVWGAIGAVFSTSLTFVVGSLTFSYLLEREIRTFVPFNSLLRSALSSSLMGLGLYVLMQVFPIDNIFKLIAIVIFGFSIYIFSAKVFRVFDKDDRDILLQSNIPFRGIVLKVLFPKD